MAWGRKPRIVIAGPIGQGTERAAPAPKAGSGPWSARTWVGAGIAVALLIGGIAFFVMRGGEEEGSGEGKPMLPDVVRCHAIGAGSLKTADLSDAVEVKLWSTVIRRRGADGWEERTLGVEDKELAAVDRTETLEAFRLALAPWKSVAIDGCAAREGGETEVCSLRWEQEAATGAEFLGILEQLLERPFCLSEAAWSGETMTAVIRGRIELTRG